MGRDRGAGAGRVRVAWARSLFAKGALLLVAVMGAVSLLAGGLSSWQLYASLRGELDLRGRSLLHTLERHQDLRLAIALKDAATARAVLEDLRAADGDVAYVAAVAQDGSVLAAASRDADPAARVARELALHPLDGPARSDGALRRFTQVVTEAGGSDGLGMPGAAGPVRSGGLVLGLDARRLVRIVAIQTLRTVGATGAVLLVAFLAFFWTIARRTARMVSYAEALAAGRLDVALEETSADELGRLAGALSRLGENTAAVVRQLRVASASLHAASREVLSGAESQLELTSRQAAGVKQTGAVVERLRGAFSEAGTRAEGVIALAQASEESTRAGTAAVDEAVAAIVAMRDEADGMARSVEDLVERTGRIGSIMEAMHDLAEQSHVLALNASIEATRAGERGRGFGVVAQEVRTLAQRQRDASAEVQRIVGDLQRAARASAALVETSRARAQDASHRAQSSGEAIRRLASTIGESSAAATAIAGTTGAQATAVAEIVQAIKDVLGATDQVTRGVGSLREASESIAQHADQMGAIVNTYRVEEAPRG